MSITSQLIQIESNSEIEDILEFEKTGKEIKAALTLKLEKLKREKERLTKKVFSLLQDSALTEKVLAYRDEIYQILPEESPPREDELWKIDPSDKEQNRNKFIAVQTLEMYHDIKHEIRYLKAIKRNLLDQTSYTLLSTHLLRFGL